MAKKHEYIVCAAINHGAQVWTLPKPNRHCHIQSMMIAEHAVTLDDPVKPDEYGFWASESGFVSRRAAARIAYRAKQLIRPWRNRMKLFSEDVW